MNQNFDDALFNHSLNESTQFPNSFGNGGGEEGGERVNMPPLSPRSSMPLSSLCSPNPFNVGDGVKRVGRPPVSPRSSFGNGSPYYQNPLNNYRANGGLPPLSPRNSFPISSSYSQIPTTHQQSISPSLSQPSQLSSFDSFPPLSPSLSQPLLNSSFNPLPPLSEESHSSFDSFPSLSQPSHVSSFDPLPPLSQPSYGSSFDSFPPLNHSPSLYQPSHESPFNPLPPLSPSPSFFSDSPSAPMENRDNSSLYQRSSLSPIPNIRKKHSIQVSESNQPSRKTHRRTMSEIPSEWDQIVKDMMRTESKLPTIEDESIISSFMDLDTNDSNGSNTRANASKSKRPQRSTSGVKRRAGKEIASPSSRHNRSVSVGSSLDGKLIINEESSKLPPKSSQNGSDKLTVSEMKQIAGEDRLMEMAKSDPKSVRRILTNRNSAQRTQARRTQYLTDLENKVIKVENENTALSSQLANAQGDKIKLMRQINELMIRLEESEKHAKTSDALIEHLTAEVELLKLATGERSQI